VRRTLVSLVALLAVLSAVPAFSAESDPPGEELQTQSGSVALPTRFTSGGGFPGLGRRVYNATQASNGVIAFIFDVDRETWGGAFVLGDVTDATGEGDLDVFFYDEMGDAGVGAPTTTGEFATRGVGGEVGFVPEGSRKAVVFTYNALNSSFTYRGFAAPVISLATGDLDLTVAPGATVKWLNDTEDYAFVRHTPAEGDLVLFDSSPAQGTGIRVGDTFEHVFGSAGTYTYVTPGGTGTVTVADPAA
jgi:hypothetical protein